MNLLKDKLIESLEEILPKENEMICTSPSFVYGCGCTGNCGQSCSGGCETGCSGNCGRSCSGACS